MALTQKYPSSAVLADTFALLCSRIHSSLSSLFALLCGEQRKGCKCGDSAIKSLRDSASSSSSKQVRRFSNAFDSPAFKASNSDKLKQAEESLRTIMYLSCWA